MTYYFIYNPIAGRGLKKEIFYANIDTLKKNHPSDEFIVYETKGVGDAILYSKKIAMENVGTDIYVFACGGDGTCNEVLNGIAEYNNVIFGIIPTGSCNDFLKYFKDLDFMNIENQLNGNIRNIDILKVDSFYCLNVTNIGFDAKVNFDQIQLRPRYKTIKQAYNRAIINNLLKPRRKRGDEVIIKADGKEIYHKKALMMAFGNASYYGGGYMPTPKAKLDDGLTDIAIVKNITIPKFVSLIKAYREGKVFENPKYNKICVFGRARMIEVESEQILTICIDGETIHRNHITIENLPKQIRFIVPKA